MKKQTIPIVFSANNMYTYYTYIAMYSLVKNTTSDYDYKIYLMQTDMSEDNCKMLESLSRDNVQVKCINILEYTRNITLKSSLHLSVETYYRLFIPYILPQYEKVLYLDSDMCILSDVAELYNQDIGEYAIGAAHDVPCRPLQIHSMDIGDLDYRKTFNAGVLVINTVRFEEQKIREKCLQLLYEDYKRTTRKLIFADQDALNLVLYDNYYVLDSKWNYQPQFVWREEEVFEEFKEDYLNGINDALIMHFAGEKKPWKNPDLPASEIFWEYVKKTDIHLDILTFIMNDIKSDAEKLDCFETYKFPYDKVKPGSKIVLYAAGVVGKAFKEQLAHSQYAQVVLWVDRDSEKFDESCGVKPVEAILDVEYDYLIIAVESEFVSGNIKNNMIDLNVPEDKIVWDKFRNNN